MDPQTRGRKLLDFILDGNEKAIKELLAVEPGGIDFKAETRGDNAIHLAARRGNVSLIRKLYRLGVKLNQKNQAKNTAMHYAAKNGHMELVLYLKKHRAKLNPANADGDRPLHRAVTSQTMNIIEQLIDLGMDPNKKNKMTGDTPLHTALRTGAQEAMEGLLIKGAKPNIPNKDGYRPVDVGKNKEIRESLRMYSTLLIAMSAGYIMANGLKIRRTDLRDNLFLVERVGIIVRKFDFPVELPSVGFYCRREKAENTSIELPPYQEETVFSDIFHIRLFDAMRDCGATLYLPLYQCPSDKEEVVLRYLNSDIPDRPMSQYIEQNNEHFCEATLTLIPETTFVCLLYVRQKREVHTVGTEEFKFLSEMVEEFEMAIPQGTFEEDTSISLQVFETNTDDDKILDEEDFQDTSGPATDDPNTNLQDPAEDPNEDAISPTDSHMPVEDTASGAMQDKNDSVSLKDKVCDLTEDNPIVNADSSDIQHINNADAQVLEEDLDENSSVKQRSVSVNPDLLTDVYQINVGGKQPNGKVKLSLPFCQDLGSEDECVIVSTNENSLNENSIEVIQTSVIQGNLVFEVSHFSIFVATWKRKLKSETEVSDEIREQICNTRDKKKPASFFVAVRKISNTDDKHTLVVDCGLHNRVLGRLKKWVDQGYLLQNPRNTGAMMMAPGETFVVCIEGNAVLEDSQDALQRKIQFYQCRSSHQPYIISLKPEIYDEEEAFCHVVISSSSEAGTKEVTRLRVALPPLPKPVEPQRTPSPVSPSPPTILSPSTSPPSTPIVAPAERKMVRSKSTVSYGSSETRRIVRHLERPKTAREVKERIEDIVRFQHDPEIVYAPPTELRLSQKESSITTPRHGRRSSLK